MKKILLILFCLSMICPISVFSQDEVSFKLGLNQAKITGKDISKGVKWKGGLAMGTSFVNHFSKYFTLDFEFSYIENGYEQSGYYDWYGNYIVSKDKDTYFYNYLVFSLLYRLYLENLISMPLQQLSVFALAGPNISVLLNPRVDVKGDNSYTLYDREVYDFGVSFGLGVGYITTIGTLYLITRYNMGFIELSKNFKAKNQALTFMLCYSFALGNIVK